MTKPREFWIDTKENKVVVAPGGYVTDYVLNPLNHCSHVIEYSALEQAHTRIRELEAALEEIASGSVYVDGKPGKTPKTRARAALKGEG